MTSDTSATNLEGGRFMGEWTRVGSVADFGEKIVLVELGRSKVAIVRAGGEWYAFNGICPHLGGPLYRGKVEGTVITCPLHGWRFDVRGGGRELHGYRPVAVYETRIVNDDLFVRL